MVCLKRFYGNENQQKRFWCIIYNARKQFFENRLLNGRVSLEFEWLSTVEWRVELGKSSFGQGFNRNLEFRDKHTNQLFLSTPPASTYAIKNFNNFPCLELLGKKTNFNSCNEFIKYSSDNASINVKIGEQLVFSQRSAEVRRIQISLERVYSFRLFTIPDS